ncbi:lysosomal acid glucosylceramidase-like [Thamnophis elegans]|uniref:lysosomal acid glucosylceramidase-like n=1 Tax=Thamnophis elegans TaxID=35005 RepID=UPI0013767D69|nr:lysosomal acid glucosylceramidase-like [Thamnophis elegans]
MQKLDVLAVLFLVPLGMVEAGARQPCSPKFLGQNAMVCVCNATYCDTVEPLSLPEVGNFVKYTTSKEGQRLERSEGQIGNASSGTSGGIFYTYDPSVQHQYVKGFGGSLTDSAAINVLRLSYGAQNHLLRSYFSDEGIEYNLLRWPIGCSDFSTRPYSYGDRCVDDFELKCFELAPEDTKLRIPLLHRIMAHAERPLSLVGSPWTSPGWLRVNNKLEGKSRIKGKPGDRYHKTWARYFIRFLDEYAKNNITFWAVSAQNEPRTLLWLFYKDFPVNIFSPQHQRDFIIKDLGPALAASCHPDVHLIILDDQRSHLPNWANQVIGNSSAATFVSGIGVHWYVDFLVPAGPTLDVTHRLYPNFFLLYTEACNGFLYWDVKVALGSWERGTYYSRNILSNLNHFVTGWIDWNLALDMEGGPCWIDNFVDSPIIVNPLKDEFYKQPMFYHLGHFSKFIPEGSVRVALTSPCLFDSCQLKALAFLRPDGTAVVVVLNDWFVDISFTILDHQVGYIKDRARAHSIQTYLWRRHL